MRFEKGHKIDERFEVVDLCSDNGGMGEILFVDDLSQPSDIKLVLKYCKEDDLDSLKRFEREVRLMTKFENNPKIINIIYSNTKFSPPYFVMEYYKNGDLSKIAKELKNNYVLQEKIICSMIDCIQELHIEKIFHRDIKPANFLLNENNEIVVTDFGLGVEIDSISRMTTTRTYGGTEGYYPPEFYDGGFKKIDGRSDIYMLGKSFYNLLTNKDPAFLDKALLHSALFFIIEKACNPEMTKRFKNLFELKEAVNLSYDVVQNRGENIYVKSLRLIKEIDDDNESIKIINLLENLNLMIETEQISILKKLDLDFFYKLLQNDILDYLEKFLSIYRVMAKKADYAFEFATTIAKNMQVLFEADDVDIKNKAIALDIAIIASSLTNRFDAMKISEKMICLVVDTDLSNSIIPVLMNNKDTFIMNIDLTSCKSESIINLIDVMQNA